MKKVERTVSKVGVKIGRNASGDPVVKIGRNASGDPVVCLCAPEDGGGISTLVAGHGREITDVKFYIVNADNLEAEIKRYRQDETVVEFIEEFTP